MGHATRTFTVCALVLLAAAQLVGAIVVPPCGDDCGRHCGDCASCPVVANVVPAGAELPAGQVERAVVARPMVALSRPARAVEHVPLAPRAA
jgi:hypothetical protein